MACTNCENPGATGRNLPNFIDVERVECPTCGSYDVTGPDAFELERRRTYTDEEHWRLSWALRRASDQGSPLRLPAHDLRRAMEAVAVPRSPLEKIDLLLRLC